MNPKAMPFVIILLFQLWSTCLAEQCGSQAGGKLCPNSLCCSQYGYCGSDSAFCGTGCQSQCGGSSGPGVSSIISSGVFDRLFDHRSDGGCPAHGFYTHDAFLTAASAFSGFGTTGDTDTAKRELAAFFANAAHETTGGCYKQEIDQSNPYCSPSAEWPCAPGKYYYGRGPLQISWNYNYGPAGRAINFDGINNPEIVASDPVISFKTAIWFWMTPQSPKPSCHSAITGGQGFGETINIINGGLECGGKSNSFQKDTIRLYTNSAQEDRIRLYKSYCGILGVQPGDKLTC